MDNIKKFQVLLEELFQFSAADLDFGIYRIMNYKRGVIERFIQEDLPRFISEELTQGALAGQTQAATELETFKKKVLEALGDDALEATIYNHLYAFFSRYWQDGDFISKRRYAKRERYAVPYNGEEVTLYWANHDQYYIKTGEYFTDYTWKAPNGVTVHFKLTAADVEHNNVKGDKRFFLPQPDRIVWDESAQIMTIPFEFRPLNGQEAIAYGGRNQQEAIIARAVENITKQSIVKDAPLAQAALEAATEGWNEKDYKRDKEFVAAQKLTEGMDEVYVNGDSYIPGARALEKLFKERMLSPVEA